MEDCIFCKIVKGEIPCYKIYEDEFCLAFLDIACDAYGHTLVIPKKHVTNVLDEDCDSETLAHVVSAAQKVSRHYVNDCGFDGVDLFVANGKYAEQSVFHLHFHIIPRKQGDGMRCWPFDKAQQFNLKEIAETLKID